MMDDLRPEDFDFLVAGGYLARKVSFPTPECSYHGKDLTGGGTVFCAKHGSPEPFNDGPGVYEGGNVIIKDNTPWTINLWNQLAPFISLLINIPIFLIGLYCTYRLILLPFQIFASVMNSISN